jgi:hypothetical protein
MSKTFNIKNLIGKPLTAKVATKLYRSPSDNAKHYASVAAGQSLGILFSWINPSSTSNSLWFMFYDSNNKPYYVKYGKSVLNVNDLKRQGIKDVETETKESKEKEDIENKGAFRFYLEKYAPFLIGAIFIIPLAKKIIDKKL